MVKPPLLLKRVDIGRKLETGKLAKSSEEAKGVLNKELIFNEPDDAIVAPHGRVTAKYEDAPVYEPGLWAVRSWWSKN